MPYFVSISIFYAKYKLKYHHYIKGAIMFGFPIGTQNCVAYLEKNMIYSMLISKVIL